MIKQKDTLFTVFGGQKIGLKAEDLENNRQKLEEAGFIVPEGYVIAEETFEKFLQTFKINQDEEKEDILIFPVFEDIIEINKKILQLLEIGKPYAIRSSALSERGGIGIYNTTFFVPSGNNQKDMECIWNNERLIYASEFSEKALAWRRKHSAKIGMALIIQPVVGAQIGNLFFPSLNGQAYTNHHGKPLVRLVTGLAYADAGNELIDFIDVPSQEEFQQILRSQSIMSTIHLNKRSVLPVSLREDTWPFAYANIPDKFPMQIFDKLEALRQHGDAYIEWAVSTKSSEEIEVIQCAPYKDKTIFPIEIELEDKLEIASGTDTVNYGIKKAKYLVYMELGYWYSQGVEQLGVINEDLTDYILVVPQEAFSSIAYVSQAFRIQTAVNANSLSVKGDLEFVHFSNACGLIEAQRELNQLDKMNAKYASINTVNHTGGGGGQHFRQLCDREDILFLGTEFDPRPLHQMCQPYFFDEGIQIWQGDFTLFNNVATGEGTLYVNKDSLKSIISEYRSDWLDGISDELRHRANNENDYDKQCMLYCISYLIPSDSTKVFVDPFFIDPAVVEIAGKDQTINYLCQFIEEGDKFFPHDWLPKMKKYFTEFLEYLKKSEEPIG